MIELSPPIIQTSLLQNGEESTMIELAPRASEKDIQAKLKKRVKRLLRKNENKYCVDCLKPNPKWAALIAVPSAQGGIEGPYNETFYIGCFCCIECSGAHRRLGTHISFVRSIDLDTLKENEIKALEYGGNCLVNEIFEGKYMIKSIKPEPESGQKVREGFIRSKYEKKKYLDIKPLANFRQTMIHRDLRSPQSIKLSPLSTCSSPTFAHSPNATSPQQQLQIFTSDPRTLALIEKYMNPKPKKKGLGRMMFSFKKPSRRKGHFKGDVSNLRGLVNVNPHLNVVETRSECGPSPKSAFDDAISVSSTRSSMSASIRRRIISSCKKMLPSPKNLSTPKKSTSTTNSAENTRRKRYFGKKQGFKLFDDSCEGAEVLIPRKEMYNSMNTGRFSPSPASSTDSSRKFRFSIRTPRGTPKKKSKESGHKKKGGDHFFSDEGGLHVVKEVGSSDVPDEAWSKRIDKATSKVFKKRWTPRGQGVDDVTLLQEDSNDTL
jgi:hypothetical protein